MPEDTVTPSNGDPATPASSPKVTTSVTDNPVAMRYELRVDGKLAGFADYRAEADRVLLTHVETAAEFGGKGLGRYLVTQVVADLTGKGRQIVPVCPFAKSIIGHG